MPQTRRLRTLMREGSVEPGEQSKKRGLDQEKIKLIKSKYWLINSLLK